ncbi:MAG: Ig-like domain-containing protein [Prevotella sp.]|nr:Ig-like domain-containing protein [Prevotella sp.]
MLLKFSALAAVLISLYSCASIGNPSGGPRDEDPPRFVKSNPAPGSTNVSTGVINIDFNELVNVKDAFSNVTVSPPSVRTPRVSSNGSRRVTVTFQDTLLANTTYTIDFGNAIEDVNESNPLEGFTYTFSTGPELDSLRISGMVFDAATLEPVKQVLVGVHSILADSTFMSLPFEKVAKTDEMGRFVVRGLKPGPYRVFALQDMNNDFKWDNPEESIAFYPEIVVPQTEQVTVADTIYDLKTMQIDTVVNRMRTRFLPNDLLLSLFNINFKQQYPVTTSRPDSTKINLVFNAKSPVTPSLIPINISPSDDWYDLERSVTNDTLMFWLRDPEMIKADTLSFRLDYTKVLRNGDLEAAVDTITLVKPVVKKPKASKKKDKKEGETDIVKPELLSINVSAPSMMDIYAPVILETDQPLETFYSDAVHLEHLIDSVWSTVPDFGGVTLLDSLQIRKYAVKHPWEYGEQYRLRIDSLGVQSIYGLSNGPINQSFTIKKESDYSILNFSITGLNDSIPAFIELLSSSDSPLRRAPVMNGNCTFKDVNPGTYYARLTIDSNGNGIFDTGNYDSQTQPEIVFYYPKKINLKKNWTIDQMWSLYDTAVDKQKPDAIRKNKPSVRKRGKKQTENTEEEDDDYFDPTVNPFDPKSVEKSKRNRSNAMRTGSI